MTAVLVASHHRLERVITGQRDLDRGELLALQATLNGIPIPEVQLCAPLLGEPMITAYALAFDLGTAAVTGIMEASDCTGSLPRDHEWGHGCGQCAPCDERLQAWTIWRGR
jgi:7-cyano-7-deazaguanine synthase in queuosine biosynthesis